MYFTAYIIYIWASGERVSGILLGEIVHSVRPIENHNTHTHQIEFELIALPFEYKTPNWIRAIGKNWNKKKNRKTSEKTAGRALCFVWNYCLSGQFSGLLHIRFGKTLYQIVCMGRKYGGEVVDKLVSFLYSGFTFLAYINQNKCVNIRKLRVHYNVSTLILVIYIFLSILVLIRSPR